MMAFWIEKTAEGAMVGPVLVVVRKIRRRRRSGLLTYLIFARLRCNATVLFLKVVLSQVVLEKYSRSTGDDVLV